MAPESEGGASGELSDQSREDQYPADWEERRREVLQRDEFTCKLCGRRGGPYAEDESIHLHAHHTIPPSQGGSNDVDNLITLCNSCYEHHYGGHGGGGGGTEWLSIGTLSATWVVLVGMTVATLEFFSSLLGESILGGNPLLALVGAVVLFALAVRLCSADEYGPAFGTVGAVLTWLVPLEAGGDLWIVSDVVGTPAVFGAAVLITVVPFATAQQFDFGGGGDSLTAQSA